MDASRLSLIMAALSSALAYDQRRSLNQLTSDLELNIKKRNPKLKKKKAEVDEEMDSDMEDAEVQESESPTKQNPRGKSSHSLERTCDWLKQEEKLISNAARVLQAQQIALEVLANLCSGDGKFFFFPTLWHWCVLAYRLIY